MPDNEGFLSKKINDFVTIATTILAVIIGFSQLILLFVESPREINERKRDRTQTLSERFTEIWYGAVVTQFRDAVVRVERNNLPTNVDQWSSLELDRLLYVNHVFRGVSLCLQNNDCERSILDEQLCSAVKLYDQGYRTIAVFSRNYPNDLGPEVKWLAKECE